MRSTKKKKVDTKAKESVREKNAEEWREVEDLIMKYKVQFNENATDKEIQESKEAASMLLERFYPLFKKYLVLIKSDQIDFKDTEMRRFVLNFIGDKKLKGVLKRRNAAYTPERRAQIAYRFNFVCSSYGQLPEDEILLDLETLFLVLAKRYKQMGKSFCGYLYNTYCYEVARFIKKHTEDPSNLEYKKHEYDDYMNTAELREAEEGVMDRLFETSTGIPDMTWICGQNCSEMFDCLTPLERKIIVQYYLEDYKDRQIADHLGLHINTINQKRRQAVHKVADAMHVDYSQIRRTRKSGKRGFAG